jgi:hypothetical protein
MRSRAGRVKSVLFFAGALLSAWVGWATAQAGGIEDEPLWPHESDLCGPIALYLACRSYGISNYPVQVIADMASYGPAGTSMGGLQKACDGIGLKSLAVRLNGEAVRNLLERRPSTRIIVLVSNGHYCYVDRIRNGELRVTRFPFKPQWVKLAELEKAWTGETLVVSLDPLLPDMLHQKSMFKRSVLAALAGAVMAGSLCWCTYLIVKSVSKRGTGLSS